MLSRSLSVFALHRYDFETFSTQPKEALPISFDYLPDSTGVFS